MSRDKDKGHLLIGQSSLSLTLSGTTQEQAGGPSLPSYTKALQDFASSDFIWRFVSSAPASLGAPAGTQHGTGSSCQP